MITFRIRRIFVLILTILSISSVFLFLLSPVVMAENKPVDLEVGIAGKDKVSGVTEYIATIYAFASGIVAGLAAIMIVIGGIQYATAAGNQKGISQAKETITSAIIGLVIVGAGYLILETFGTQFTNLKEPDLGIGKFPSKSPWKNCEWMAIDTTTGYCPVSYVSVDAKNCGGSSPAGNPLCCCQDKDYEEPPDRYEYRYCDGSSCAQGYDLEPRPSECTYTDDCWDPFCTCFDKEEEASVCQNGYRKVGDIYCCFPNTGPDCKKLDEVCSPGSCCAGWHCVSGKCKVFCKIDPSDGLCI